LNKGRGKSGQERKFDRNIYLKAAEELRYSDETIQRLHTAKDDEACSRIMHDARKGLI
jgi:hypothetical protein